MTDDFSTFAQRWSAEDHASFEALCFHRADEVAAPYTELMCAPEIGDRAKPVAAEIVQRAYEDSKEGIARAWASDIQSGGEIFAYAIAKRCEGPGRIPGLISTNSWKHLDLFECNIMQERGGAIDSYFTEAFACGLVWDSYWFFENAYGEETSVSFTVYHLTQLGLDYCLWRFPERVEALRKAEQARS